MVEASHRVILETIYKGSRASFALRSIRFVRPDVAVLFSHAHLTFCEGGETREIDTRPAMTMTKQDAKWQIVTFQNAKISEMPVAAETARRLAS